MGPEDIIAIVSRYFGSMIAAIIASCVVLAISFVLKRRLSRPRVWHLLVSFLAITPLIYWAIYVRSTSHLTYTLAMLDSESSRFAERIYEERFKKEVLTINQAVGLAVDKSEAPNVRFYAACLVADLLATRDENTIVNTLQSVEDAPTIDTQFFGGNKLTDLFYVPGHDQVHLPVRNIIERRLRELNNEKRR
jgi:hypothetical protein